MGQQLLVVAYLYGLAVLNYHDDVRHTDRRETVGDEHHGLVLGHLRELFIESVLAKGIQCRRGLVENENLRVTHEGAGNREVLPLASGEIDALVEGLAENRFVAVGQPTDDVMGAGLLGGGLHERSLVNGVEADMS